MSIFGRRDPDLDQAMLTVWALGDWPYLTCNMDPAHREAAACAVQRALDANDSDPPNRFIRHPLRPWENPDT